MGQDFTETSPASTPDILEEDIDDHGGTKRTLEDVADEQQAKRTRMEYLEIYHAKIDKLMQSKLKKEIKIKEVAPFNQECFKKAIDKEI